MRQMYNFVGLVNSPFCVEHTCICLDLIFCIWLVSHETLCIAILLYVISNHLDVLISSDVICRSNAIYFRYKNMNSDETMNMHVPLCDILYRQSG